MIKPYLIGLFYINIETLLGYLGRCNKILY